MNRYIFIFIIYLITTSKSVSYDLNFIEGDTAYYGFGVWPSKILLFEKIYEDDSLTQFLGSFYFFNSRHKNHSFKNGNIVIEASFNTDSVGNIYGSQKTFTEKGDLHYSWIATGDTIKGYYFKNSRIKEHQILTFREHELVVYKDQTFYRNGALRSERVFRNDRKYYSKRGKRKHDLQKLTQFFYIPMLSIIIVSLIIW